MKPKKQITILGKTIDIAFNMATQIAYEEIVGEPFDVEALKKTSNTMVLYYACIIANNKETDLTFDQLLMDADANDIATLKDAVISSFTEWCKPAVTSADKKKQKKETVKKKLISAHDAFSLLVGEIGIDRHEFLFVLRLWEINAIVEGYRRRGRTIWDASRWQAWLILCALGAKGLHRPENLQRFPWDEDEGDVMTKEDADKLRREMTEINKQLAKKHAKNRQDNSALH